MSARDNVRMNLIWLIDNRTGGSKAEFARSIGVYPQKVNNWVHGNNAPELETVGMIAMVYDLSLDWLIGGDASKAPSDYKEADNG